MKHQDEITPTPPCYVVSSIEPDSSGGFLYVSYAKLTGAHYISRLRHEYDTIEDAKNALISVGVRLNRFEIKLSSKKINK